MALTRVPSDLGKLSDARLMELWTAVGAEAAERKAEAKRLAAEVESRQVLQEALDKLSPAQVEALRGAPVAQVAYAEGIESEEEVRGG